MRTPRIYNLLMAAMWQALISPYLCNALFVEFDGSDIDFNFIFSFTRDFTLRVQVKVVRKK